jgi:hypothetical protein
MLSKLYRSPGVLASKGVIGKTGEHGRGTIAGVFTDGGEKNHGKIEPLVVPLRVSRRRRGASILRLIAPFAAAEVASPILAPNTRNHHAGRNH